MDMHRTQGVAAAHVLFLPALLILLFEQRLPREPIAPCDITLDFWRLANVTCRSLPKETLA